MKIKIIYIGRDKKNHHKEAIDLYLKRLKHYTQLIEVALKPPKYAATESIDDKRKKEEQLILKNMTDQDEVWLMDETGMQYNSTKFAEQLQLKMNQSVRCLCLIIGGAAGFSAAFKKEYPTHLALSKMTYSHHLARLVLLEQIYRAYTILNNEPYHNS